MNTYLYCVFQIIVYLAYIGIFHYFIVFGIRTTGVVTGDKLLMIIIIFKILLQTELYSYSN